MEQTLDQANDYLAITKKFKPALMEIAGINFAPNGALTSAGVHKLFEDFARAVAGDKTAYALLEKHLLAFISTPSEPLLTCISQMLLISEKYCFPEQSSLLALQGAEPLPA
jgi:hypothetical protein